MNSGGAGEETSKFLWESEGWRNGVTHSEPTGVNQRKGVEGWGKYEGEWDAGHSLTPILRQMEIGKIFEQDQ